MFLMVELMKVCLLNFGFMVICKIKFIFVKMVFSMFVGVFGLSMIFVL